MKRAIIPANDMSPEALAGALMRGAPADAAVDGGSPKPFLKWVGGKNRLLPYIAPHFPERIPCYWEPFVGGGAVFFAMADRIENATLSDLNAELVDTYIAVKTRVDDVLDVLVVHAKQHAEDDDYYYRVRADDPVDLPDIAARMIYLNKTCYNGLYRVNKSGGFNSPKGRYVNPNICDEPRLRAASKALARARIVCGNYADIVKPKKGHVVYCDPPYDDCFANYQSGGFTADDQHQLSDVARRWSKRGARVLLSNSDTTLIRGLYDGFDLHCAMRRECVNAAAEGRGKVAEILAVSK